MVDLETVERLAELQIKRSRVLQLAQSAGLVGLADKARVYHHAARVLHVEIERIEALIGQEL